MLNSNENETLGPPLCQALRSLFLLHFMIKLFFGNTHYCKSLARVKISEKFSLKSRQRSQSISPPR